MANRKTSKTKIPKPEKSTAKTYAQAQMDSRRALIERGGKLLHVRLEADAFAAIAEVKRMYGLQYDREAIAYALLALTNS